MGVKSTQHLSRKEAENLFVELKQKAKERKIRAKAVALNNVTLEDELERLNDAAHDGEGFANYIIVD